MIDIQTGKLRFRAVQSPMAGCSDLAFRLVSRRRGMDYCFLEMVSAVGLVHGGKNSLALLKTVPEDKPVGAQLVGCDPDVMGRAAEMIEELGFYHLDLNLGCPVRKVTSTGAGAALMDKPAQAGKVFKSVVRAVKKIPVTVKIRKGFKDDSGRQAVDIARVAEDSGIRAVTVHGRTQAQGYTGKADWTAIGRVKKSVSIPVLGNGDILSAEDARRLMEESGCDGVMIGRGGLGNPWLFAQIRDVFEGKSTVPSPGPEEKKEAVLEHMSLEEKYQGSERAVFHMRRIGAWYIQGSRHASFWRNRLNQCRTLSDVAAVLVSCLDGKAPPHETAN